MSTDVVQSVGNAWIICRSKSYHGRIYYFNSLTGEAVWNLSEPEIEKAKNTTQVLQSQSDFNIDNYPEPMETPQESVKRPKTPVSNVIPTEIYNKQIINNKFPKSSNVYATQIFPHRSLNLPHPLPFTLPISPVCNSGVWNNPPPIFVTSTSINQAQPLVNNNVSSPEFDQPKTLVPVSSRFKEANMRINPEAGFDRNCNTRNNVSGFRKNVLHINGIRNPNKYGTDLRLLLTSKRRKLTDTEDDGNEIFEEKTEKYVHIPLKTTSYSNIEEEEQDESNEQVSPKTLDTTSLKNCLQVSNVDIWYIIADSNILLNHIDFVNGILKTDTQCRLLVPHIVMNIIQNATNSRFRTQAHRAAYFILENIDSNHAVMVEGNSEENIHDKYEIIRCCNKFTNEGRPVIILTDDIELHSYDKTIAIYTLRELKRLLYSKLYETRSKGSESALTVESRTIQITFPNDTTTVDCQQDSESSQDRTANLKNNVNETSLTTCNAAVNKHSLDNSHEHTPLDKTTDDIGVQADTMLNNYQDKSIDTFDIYQNDLKSNHVRLKRNHLTMKSIYDMPSKSDVIESKKYSKWHRNREKSNQMSKKSNFDTQTSNSNEDDCESSITNDRLNFHAIENLRTCHEDSSKDSLTNANNDEENVFCIRKLNDNLLCSTESSQKESLYKTGDEDSCETNSVISEKVHQNFIVEETSSDISNTESDKAIFVNKKSTINKEIIEDKNVMFEITSQAMQEYLRMKCDEWIYRFVQIMEEVLTHVLQIDPPYILETMLPPWNIYEAVECVKRKFNVDYDVLDASNKMSNVLFEIGSLRGKIRKDISPKKYMEMYSYGVYLIDSLQGILSNNEELQIASERLSKLLSDIQDPHLDPTNQDSFHDVHAENQTIAIRKEYICNENYKPAEECVEPIVNKETITSVPEHSSPKIIINSEINSSPSNKYNLRSFRRKVTKDSEEIYTQVTFNPSIDPEMSFFSSLDLKKKLSPHNNSLQSPTSLKLAHNLVATDNVEDDNTESISKNVSNTEQNVDLIPTGEAKNNEPKVIRKFIRCVEFEKRLKNNLPERNFDHDNWTIPSETDYRNEELDYDLQDEYYYGNNYEYRDFEYFEDVPEDTQVIFQSMVGKIENHIKNEFLSIHEFCKTSYDTLTSSNCDVKKNNIKQLAEETHFNLNTLCKILNSILTRETSDSEYRIQNIFTIGDNVPDDDLENYRSFIAKCLQQGIILKESIESVIEASK